MHQYYVYYEPSDTDDERVCLGIIIADTAADALDKAAQYYEYPSHDLVVELIR